MQTVEIIQKFNQIKTLTDTRRMNILRLLMDKPATLSHLAQSLEQSPAWVRHHIQKLESASLIELSEIRKNGKITERFYRAKAGAFLLQGLVIPKSDKPVIIFSGSSDIAMETAITHLNRYAHLLTLPVGSLDGLINLRQRLCQISGIHLLDETGEYNTPYVRRIFPDRDMQLITLAHRTQGLITAPGNPLGIHATSDLPQTGLRFINRNPGSGTRIWLDKELKKLAIPFETIAGYQHTLSTHLETARAVAEGRADATLGLQAAAHKFGLAFSPLFHERYDLIFPRDLSVHVDILLNYIQSGDFRHQLDELRGYESTHTGELVAL